MAQEEQFIKIDWTGIAPEAVTWIYDQGQIKLKESTVVTQAGAQRSTATATIFAAGMLGFLGVAGALAAGAQPHPYWVTLALCAALQLLAAAVLAVRAALPTDILTAGQSPDICATNFKTLVELQKESAEETAYWIVKNRAFGVAIGARLMAAYRVAASTILIAPLIALVVYLAAGLVDQACLAAAARGWQAVMAQVQAQWVWAAGLYRS